MAAGTDKMTAAREKACADQCHKNPTENYQEDGGIRPSKTSSHSISQLAGLIELVNDPQNDVTQEVG
jgi:hypothetical protein